MTDSYVVSISCFCVLFQYSNDFLQHQKTLCICFFFSFNLLAKLFKMVHYFSLLLWFIVTEPVHDESSCIAAVSAVK